MYSDIIQNLIQKKNSVTNPFISEPILSYSTDEVIFDFNWIDDFPYKRKVIVLDAVLEDTVNEYDHNISGLVHIISMKGSFKDNNGNYYPLFNNKIGFRIRIFEDKISIDTSELDFDGLTFSGTIILDYTNEV